MTLEERGESFYQELMPGVVADLDNKSKPSSSQNYTYIHCRDMPGNK